MGYPCIVAFSPVIIKYDHLSSCCFKERLTGYLCFRLPFRSSILRYIRGHIILDSAFMLIRGHIMLNSVFMLNSDSAIYS